jgi:uncharacterized protein (DUF362 family)
MSEVYAVGCKDYSEQIVGRAMAELIEQNGLLKDIKNGTRVVIKANLVIFMKPEKAATTHPALLCELVRILKKRGAQVVIGDSPGGVFTKAFVDRVYAVTDMKRTEQCGALLNQNFNISEADFPEALIAKKFEYTSYLRDADVIINFCKLKSHGMMGMSAAVKNMFGAVPGLLKPQYHYRYPRHSDFANMLIDLNEYFKPSLSIVDAVVGMEGNGPTMGTPRHIGVLLASENPYQLDLVAAHLIGLGKEEVPTLQEAYKRGFIPADVHDLHISGDIDRYIAAGFDSKSAQEDFTFYAQTDSVFGKMIGSIAKKVFISYPGLGKTKCIACRKCEDICPAKAIMMKNGKAVIDRKKCIRCFCCQEFCVTGAMVSKQSAIGRIILKRRKNK